MHSYKHTHTPLWLSSPLFLQSSRAAARPEFTMGSLSRIVVEAVPNYRRGGRKDEEK